MINNENPTETILHMENNQSTMEAHSVLDLDSIPIQETRSAAGLINLKESLKLKHAARLEELLHQKQINSIKAIAQQVYPDRWDFVEIQHGEFGAESGNKYRLVIHFPVIVITNSRGQSHTIKDLYVQMLFKRNLTMNGGLYGNRTTRTYAEVQTSYIHSHRRVSGVVPFWDHFCLGSETPMANAVMDCYRGFTEERIKFLLFTLDFYIHWESLEGGPYIKIDTPIHYNPNRSSRGWYPDNNHIHRRFEEFIRKYETIEGLKYVDNIVKPLIVDKNNKKFIEQIRNLEKGQGCLGTLDEDGTWKVYVNRAENQQQEIDSWNYEFARSSHSFKVVFRGELKQLKFEGYEYDDVAFSEDQLVPCPHVVELIAKKLEDQVNKFLIAKAEHEYRR